jgi:hypothetical protein
MHLKHFISLVTFTAAWACSSPLLADVSPENDIPLFRQLKLDGDYLQTNRCTQFYHGSSPPSLRNSGTDCETFLPAPSPLFGIAGIYTPDWDHKRTHSQDIMMEEILKTENYASGPSQGAQWLDRVVVRRWVNREEQKETVKESHFFFTQDMGRQKVLILPDCSVLSNDNKIRLCTRHAIQTVAKNYGRFGEEAMLCSVFPEQSALCPSFLKSLKGLSDLNHDYELTQTSASSIFTAPTCTKKPFNVLLANAETYETHEFKNKGSLFSDCSYARPEICFDQLRRKLNCGSTMETYSFSGSLPLACQFSDYESYTYYLKTIEINESVNSRYSVYGTNHFNRYNEFNRIFVRSPKQLALNFQSTQKQ